MNAYRYALGSRIRSLERAPTTKLGIFGGSVILAVILAVVVLFPGI